MSDSPAVKSNLIRRGFQHTDILQCLALICSLFCQCIHNFSFLLAKPDLEHQMLKPDGKLVRLDACFLGAKVEVKTDDLLELPKTVL